MRYLAGHSIPGVELGNDTQFQRLVRLPDGGTGMLLVELDGPVAVCATLDGGTLPESLIPLVRRLFDLDADSASIDAHLAGDPVLAPQIAAEPGIRLPGGFGLQEQLLRTMIGQQISITAARTVLGRLAAELEGTGAFPTSKQFADHGSAVLRGPARRVAAIHGAAMAMASGVVELHEELPVTELIARLVSLPGVGPWTAGYVAMRSIGAADILLSTDLVLLKGADRLGLPATARALEEYSTRWSPYRTYAGLHLWRAALVP
jgi:AraC family transcriptional regulator, regulatory protein of adaptative response / DNA-3-methyladenine glycosylase II